MDDLATWTRVLPELGDEQAVGDLLAWADALPSDLPPDPGSGAPGDRSGVGSRETPDRCSTPDDGVLGAFVAAVAAPLVARAAERLDALTVVADRERVVATAAGVARSAVAEQVVRPLVALLAEDRAARRLPGATPEDRYAAFLAHLLSPAGRARVDARHPDLLPRARGLAAQRLDALCAALEETEDAWTAVCVSLALDPDDRVVAVDPGGDAHGGGRTVLVLTTAGGRRLVVKPRPVDLEAGYAAFAAWLGRSATGLELPRPAFHRGARTGWMEHVAPGAAPHPDFHAMVGVHLAALHLLRGTDVHYENLLADPQGRPVVVDAEALFTPRLGDGARPDVLDVTATGLLRVAFPGSDFDFGALDYRRGSTSPFRAWHVRGAGRDDLRLEMGPVVVDDPETVPGGGHRTAADAEALVDAFVRCLTFAREHRAAVVARLGSDFARGRCRYVHRPTMSYALLLRMATHPRFAAEADRRRVLARLAVLAPATGPELLASEVRQLTGGEVPAFVLDLHDRRVRDARGRDTGARAAATPYDDVLALLAGLDEAHVAAQTETLRACTAHWSGGTPAASDRLVGAGDQPRRGEVQ
ncbi:DUF4135 domain-containing protein [Nocardioides sp. ChNu-99]|uniref:DUF4135 domain-containing protein n=1 Tax=Nocardioides sp. ChNu-99 TaxID=2839897 RepID=UPI002406FAB2|nr:DUF4135 domain-containing protein [Nocardioides sp. ChNu-99]MDF9717189.1 DUF4135 domain-containing protein [Nocardioides sp. ChNu-99]